MRMNVSSTETILAFLKSLHTECSDTAWNAQLLLLLKDRYPQWLFYTAKMKKAAATCECLSLRTISRQTKTPGRVQHNRLRELNKSWALPQTVLHQNVFLTPGKFSLRAHSIQ